MQLKNELNEKQYEAVTSRSRFLRIIAGAGSGKTRVLTYRIAYLISELGVEPFQILAITFTNKAAKEMKERTAKLLPDFNLNGLTIYVHTAAKDYKFTVSGNKLNAVNMAQNEEIATLTETKYTGITEEGATQQLNPETGKTTKKLGRMYGDDVTIIIPANVVFGLNANTTDLLEATAQ